jgi:CO/xanthine dehydrogenase Mo-binding subunit
LACAFKNVGYSFGFPERCEAEIVLHGAAGDEIPTSVELYHGGADVGQGAHTAVLQMAAEATGVPLERVKGHFSDTATCGDSGSASASRLTWMSGGAVLGAAEEADKAWREGARPATGRFRFVPPPTEDLDPETGICVPNFAYGYVAQGVELTVDTGTGHIVVDRVVSAHDVGRAINPALVVGQIEGAVVQAHGYALSEHLQVAGGRVLNPRFSTYLIPGIGDVPTDICSVVLELADPIGPWGLRGMAEMPMIPYAAAVVAALHDATGAWFDRFPLTPSRVLEGLDS